MFTISEHSKRVDMGTKMDNNIKDRAFYFIIDKTKISYKSLIKVKNSSTVRFASFINILTRPGFNTLCTDIIKGL